MGKIDFNYILPSGKNAKKSVRSVFQQSYKKSKGCWEWQGKKFANGYGCFYYLGKYLLAHRVMWQMLFGKTIPRGMNVCHKCDNRACVRPSHLFLGSQKENMKDMIAKGRENPPTGINHYRCKLTDADVTEIRRLWNETKKTQKELANQFEVRMNQINRIINNKRRA